ncbi:uncharacterized protein HD556DRAFT_1453981 [Suillus plorans]|uniref:Uncharacterized protein n=1 Tax=Suillus plorans TaxID=116603 RepID=A0A9P7E3K7_9AGAM|nr:uncharacterized protein HD556DRAFT_1453981 [Suillus plorans]KAG1810310.1 hypothetical protein HD556DRAFT_1453981 [Suillus plorans]
MFRPGLAQKPWLWPAKNPGRAKAANDGWLWPGSGLSRGSSSEFMVLTNLSGTSRQRVMFLLPAPHPESSLHARIYIARTDENTTCSEEDSCLFEMCKNRAHQEELAGHIKDLVTQVKHEQEAWESLERSFNDVEKMHESELRREHRALEDKESALSGYGTTVQSTRVIITIRRDRE